MRVFFQRRYGYETETYPTFKDCVKVHDLDVLVSASGFTKEHEAEFDEVCGGGGRGDGGMGGWVDVWMCGCVDVWMCG